MQQPSECAEFLSSATCDTRIASPFPTGAEFVSLLVVVTLYQCSVVAQGDNFNSAM